MSLSDGQKEKIKLRASWLNSLSSGIILTGSLAPFLAALLGVTSVPLPVVIGSSAVWLIFGSALHWLARRTAERLDQ